MLTDHPGALAQLDEELIGWLTTVNEKGQPQASPVWHVTDGNELVVYSRTDAHRLANLESNPRVAYNLRGDRQGDTIVTMEGTARIDRAAPSPIDDPSYMAKYGEEIVRLGWTPESYAAEFSVAIRVTINKVRAFGP